MKKTTLKIQTAAAVFLLAGLLSAKSQTLTLWNFNSLAPDANTGTGTLVPAVGGGTASLFGGVTGTFGSGDANGGSTDPAVGDDSGWQTTNYGNPTNKAAGVQFNVPTTGFSNIQISFDIRHSNTSSRYERLQFSIDGVNFVDSTSFTGAAGDTWFNSRTVNLTGVLGVDNNPNFAFRIVPEWESTATGAGAAAFVASNPSGTFAGSGTWRFDMVSVQSVPEPTALALLSAGLAGYALFRRRTPRQ